MNDQILASYSNNCSCNIITVSITYALHYFVILWWHSIYVWSLDDQYWVIAKTDMKTGSMTSLWISDHVYPKQDCGYQGRWCTKYRSPRPHHVVYTWQMKFSTDVAPGSSYLLYHWHHGYHMNLAILPSDQVKDLKRKTYRTTALTRENSTIVRSNWLLLGGCLKSATSTHGTVKYLQVRNQRSGHSIQIW